MEVPVHQAGIENLAVQPSERSRTRGETPRLALDLLEHRRPLDPLQDEAVPLHLEHVRDRNTGGLRAPHDRRLTLGITRLTLPVAPQDSALSVLEYVTGATRCDEYP